MFRIEQQYPGFKVYITSLVAEHTGLIVLLLPEAVTAFSL